MNLENKLEYYNPDPFIRLIARTTEAKVRIDEEEVTALIDIGAQISIVTLANCQKCGLPIKLLGTLLNIEGSGGQNVPFKGYT